MDVVGQPLRPEKQLRQQATTRVQLFSYLFTMEV
jgi:hypothetical protein